MVRRTLGTLVVVVASAFALAPEFLTAQAPPAQRLMVQIVNVKPEGLDEWLALQQKETIPALKKIGVAERQAWQTATFGEGFQYFFSQPIDKFAAYDNPQGPMVRALGQEGARVYNAKVRKLINATTTLAITVLPESIAPPPTYEPKLMVLNFTYVVPGRADDFLAYWRNDLMPVIRKAKPVGFGLSRTLHGGDANEFVSARYLEKMADLDGPNLQTQAIGAEAAAKLGAKTAGLVQRQERRIYRFVPSLSFRGKS
jgi:hypothetical protein